MEESMSLKKIALIALIVVMLLSSVIAFGCKPKAPAADVSDTTMTQPAPAPVDTAAAPAPATTPAPVTK
jgi:hypothetical protein